jgi:hypothetical protein
MVPGNYLRRLASLLLVFGLAQAATAVRTSQSAEKSAAGHAEKPGEHAATAKYLRVVHDAQARVVGLETAIVSFGPATPRAANVQIDLVAAVHIADKSYYQELNRRFAVYDAVLYELVAPEGTRIPQGGRKDKRAGNMLSAAQLGMKDVLKLEFQLDQVDYTQKNLIHADLSPEQLIKSMRDRKEGLADIFTRLLAYSLAKQAQGGDDGQIQLLMAMFDKNRSLALKRVMADQFQEMECMTAVLEGPKGSTLIGERNRRALEVLKEQIAAGKKKIAVFYGAGHMADMEKRLRADFSLKPNATQWLQAWDMK